MVLAEGTLEYIYTAGLLVSFIGMIVIAVWNRREIGRVLRDSGFRRKDLLLAIVPVAVFILILAIVVKPTQLLFFDDAIYQAMGLSLLHTGQAWMCNFGTPNQCFSGQIFHEPIGLSFNIAIGFLLLGVHRMSAYAVQATLAALSVFMTFIVAFALLKDRRSAFLSALVLALLPIILVWAYPTNSDMATLAYSLVSVFMLIVLMKRKNLLSLAAFLFSLSVLLYMKVDAFVYVPILALLYMILYEKGTIKSVSESARSLYDNILNTKLLLLILVFILIAYPTVMFAFYNSSSDGYGYQGTSIQLTCNKTVSYIKANGTINVENFKANICANLSFWANSYTKQQVAQPLYLTILAIVGALLMIAFGKGRIMAALAIWFGVIFLFYTAFYAGSVVYGVDWRFMISLMAPFAILAGTGISDLSKAGEVLASKASKDKRLPMLCGAAISIALGASLFYVLYSNSAYVFIKPSAIQQAGDARFYENFVYNSSHLIPSGCLVYTYDPTLFNINNRTATQMSNIYNSSFFNASKANYPCLVLDKGYWCNTPGNLCTQAEHTYNLTSIANATYTNGFTYGFYRIVP
ncbi:MAG: glycosyltransferase family 39 protein [Candidatus Micrarchaeota archaeon]|nr:glycosyltransferase family 39 protein [Candidatus Micrarchaeota archaeon]